MNLDSVLNFLGRNGFDREKLVVIKDESQMLLSLVKTVSWTNQFSLIESLYYEKFIPQAELLDGEANQEVSKLQQDYGVEIDYENEAYYETIRFGYLALYHKLENCRKELLKTMLPVFRLSDKEFKKKYEAYFKENFDKPRSGIVYKFSWISDCTKHQNAIASERGNQPPNFENYPKGIKIKINKEEFKNDSKELRMNFKKLCMNSALIGVMHELDNMK